jgi:hypothetical protein
MQKWACRVCKGLFEYSGDESNVHSDRVFRVLLYLIGMHDTGMGVCANMHEVEYSGKGWQKHGMQ